MQTVDRLALPSLASSAYARAALLTGGSALLAAAVRGYPLGALGLLGALYAYAVLIIYVPRAPLVLLPALLPLLDLAPLTGRFFFDEYDFLLLVTALVAACRSPVPDGHVRMHRRAQLLFGLFALSVLAAAMARLAPLPPPDLNAFNNYYSPYNGLRLAKGLFWCLLYVPFLRQEIARDDAGTYRLLGHGMVLGVAGACAVILWERLVFTGLFNFSGAYRVAGPFAAMHIGGAFIEAYLVMALPFVAWGAMLSRTWLARAVCGAVFVAGSYCMMVTYARGGYVALLIGMVLLAAVIPFMRAVKLTLAQAFVLAALFGALTAVAVPIMRGSFMSERLSTAQRDLASRIAAWKAALKTMDDGPMAALAGMGSGRYPLLSYLGATGVHQPAAYRFKRDAGNTYLELTPGSPLYFEQVVPVQRPLRYRIAFRARSTGSDAALGLPICEKWLLYSRHCVGGRVKIGDTRGRWKDYVLDLPTARLPARPWYASPPVKFALFNAGGSALDIDNVSITGGRQELVRNGGFEAALDHWFFTTDRFEAWHFENTWLQLYFEQGLIGVALFGLLLVAVWRSARIHLRDADYPLPPIAAALCGFLALGMLDSLFDFPRLSLLFYLMVALILLRKHAQPSA
ncbi:MAG TPA: O-antigen ligase family protein [Burkholderiaceae bacterium]